MARTRFKSVERYIEEKSHSCPCTTVFPGIAAEFLDVSRQVVNALMKNGQLDYEIVVGQDRKWRGVNVTSLIDYKNQRDEGLTDRPEKVKLVLEKCAKEQEPIVYSELMKTIGLSFRNPSHRSETNRILCDLSKESSKESGYMISAMAVSKHTKVPNESFFNLAAELKLIKEKDIDNIKKCQTFFDNQCELVFKDYN